MEKVTYSPSKTIESSISTFLFKALGRDVDRARFINATSSTGGVGFIFRTEDLRPTEHNKQICPDNYIDISTEVYAYKANSSMNFLRHRAFLKASRKNHLDT